jgi:hypothetical protein
MFVVNVMKGGLRVQFFFSFGGGLSFDGPHRTTPVVAARLNRAGGVTDCSVKHGPERARQVKIGPCLSLFVQVYLKKLCYWISYIHLVVVRLSYQ